jgi:hypothetical protein
MTWLLGDERSVSARNEFEVVILGVDWMMAYNLKWHKFVGFICCLYK